MSTSTCPFCHHFVASSELEWHANRHFEEEELARDLELAHQIALAPTSPVRIADSQIDDAKLYEIVSERTSGCSSSRFSLRRSDHGEKYIQEKIFGLTDVQLRSTFHKVEDGLMALLSRCLEFETGNPVSIVSGYVDHFQSMEEDVGWGCGWRNIQMLSSHLLNLNLEAKEVMFGGQGFVPDIPSLQRWLEIAWDRGFDRYGSHDFKHKVYGSTKWIGTTECATLFRSFGLRARIVDFGSKANGSYALSVLGANRGEKVKHARGKRKVDQVNGPINKFFLSKNCSVPKADASLHGKSIHDSAASNHNSNDESINQDKQKSYSLLRNIRSEQVLTEWVWDYFAEKKVKESGNLQHVFVSEKTPLYFQHDGHSRTIVGIQMKQQNGMPKQYNLLVLDPGHRTEALERSLRNNVGWQKLIKRGVHTLKKPQYQLCYIDPGVAHGEEMEQLKTIHSIFCEL